jgi:hypothetical protein
LELLNYQLNNEHSSGFLCQCVVVSSFNEGSSVIIDTL